MEKGKKKGGKGKKEGRCFCPESFRASSQSLSFPFFPFSPFSLFLQALHSAKASALPLTEEDYRKRRQVAALQGVAHIAKRCVSANSDADFLLHVRISLTREDERVNS